MKLPAMDLTDPDFEAALAKFFPSGASKWAAVKAEARFNAAHRLERANTARRHAVAEEARMLNPSEPGQGARWTALFEESLALDRERERLEAVMAAAPKEHAT